MLPRNHLFGRNNISFAPGQFTYESLFHFIQRNKKLRAAVDALDERRTQDPLRERVLVALRQADSKSEAFDHPDCDIYILSLFKHNEITPEEFLTAYKFLMMLMESTERQALKKKDDYLKQKLAKKTEVVLVPMLNDEGNLSTAGRRYYNAVSKSFEFISRVVIDEDEFIEYLSGLSKLEQCIIELNAPEVATTYRETAKLSPILQAFINGERLADASLYGVGEVSRPRLIQETSFVATSHSIYRYLCPKLNNDYAMELLPAFGAVGNETLRTLHRQGWHMYPLYSRYVKSNMTFAHHRSVGPASISFHDEMHCAVSSKFTLAQRKIILDDLAGHVLDFKKHYQPLRNSSENYGMVDIILETIAYDELNDLLLVGTVPEVNVLQYFLNYMMTESPVSGSVERLSEMSYVSIGEQSSAIYFMIACGAYQDNSTAKYWGKVLEKINHKLVDSSDFHLQSSVEQLAWIDCKVNESKHNNESVRHMMTNIAMLLAMARTISNGCANELKINEEISLSVDWQKLSNKLAETLHSEQAVTFDHLLSSPEIGDDLKQLVMHCNLVVFDPVVSLSKELLSTIKDFSDKQADMVVHAETSLMRC